VDSNSKTILVLAVAGSGKTTTLVERVRRLISEGISPREFLIITFTRKAARTLKEKLSAFLPPEDLRKMYIGTSHSFCSRVIRDYAELIGYKRDYGVYDEDDQRDILTAIKNQLGLKVNIKAMLKLISRGEKDSFSPEEKRVYSEYLFRLRRFNCLDYDLILEKAVEILAEHPEAREHYHNRFSHVFMDELQDIAELEDKLLLTLSIENSMVVGDYSQSIYNFRGCSNKYILAFCDRHPGLEIIKLPVNYRSVPSICAAAESLINHNPQPFGEYRIVPARKEEGERSVDLHLGLADEERQIACGIKCSAAKPSAWAILVRTNYQIEPIRKALEEYAIPCQVVSRDLFWQREEVKNFILYLRVLCNPLDDYSMGRILRLRHLGVSESDRAELAYLSVKNERGMLAEIFLSDAANKHLPDLLSELRPSIPDLASASRAFVSAYESSRYLASLREQCLTSKVASISEIGERIKAWAEDPEADDISLPAFLESITAESAIDKWDEKKDAVSIMTIHCAKGLEFPNVIIAGCEDGLLPAGKEDQIEEERRLMFVAMTRAMNQLVIASARERKRWGKVEMCFESPFISEIKKGGGAYGALHLAGSKAALKASEPDVGPSENERCADIGAREKANDLAREAIARDHNLTAE